MSHPRQDGTARPLPAQLSSRPTPPLKQDGDGPRGREDHHLRSARTVIDAEHSTRARLLYQPLLPPAHAGSHRSPRAPALERRHLPRDRQAVLEIGFDLVSYEDVLAAVCHWRDGGERHYLTLTPPHSVLMSHADAQLRAATTAASLVLPDGVGIILAAGLLRYPHHGRITGPTLMLKLCDWGRRAGLRHFFYGGAPGVADQLGERLMEKFPGLDVAGTACPPFRPLDREEDEHMVQQINAGGADIVWVGLGSPKQEKWMAEHVGRIDAAALVGVGAAFDFHSGRVKWAPAWVRRAGVEWAYRLLKEPRRMWRRNVNSVVFLHKVLQQCVRRSKEHPTPVISHE